MCAYEHHSFEPSSTHEPSERSARVWSAPTSDPASGSDMAMASAPPSATWPSRRCFCCSEPKQASDPTTISVTGYAPIGASPRAVSSRNRHASSRPPPEPPSSSGMATPYQ
ncbi:MAG TPA: hypothetical protein VK387_01405, partial [Thermoleophilaceae bacterium]|nr:hypothetical protein [Thermoleophilaceae bacterium]